VKCSLQQVLIMYFDLFFLPCFSLSLKMSEHPEEAASFLNNEMEKIHDKLSGHDSSSSSDSDDEKSKRKSIASSVTASITTSVNHLFSRKKHECQISIKAVLTPFIVEDTNVNSYLLNVMDSPSHVNFSDEMIVARRLADGVVLVVDAAEGIM
ncbi:hypothetical protein KI387_043021, partial [Taxus chinensis]